MLEIVSTVSQLSPTVLSLRGGATVAAAATAVAINGGGRTEESLWQSPPGYAALLMALAMAFHYLGYSLARPVTVALFTSSQTGFTSPAAFPLAMAFVSPCSLLLLMGYHYLLDHLGPLGALRGSTLACAGFIGSSALLIDRLSWISGPLFVLRESYVQLLTSQYWSFLASIMTPNQSATWFAPIAGITSLASAVSGYSVTRIVSKVGLVGSLLCTSGSLLVSLLLANAAYGIANKNGFAPSNNKKKKNSEGLLTKAKTLFQREPVLPALFWEILASQGLATVLNVVFVAKVRTAIPNDTERAGWVGNFYATINIVTMVLQFAILPPLMRVAEPYHVWRVLPIVTLAVTGLMASLKDPTLRIVSLALAALKVSEYSARRMLDEMVYVPLDFESRFVAKQVLGVFGHRFGKSLMSCVLSGTSGFLDLRGMACTSTVVAVAWWGTTWRLSNLVPTRAEAQKAHSSGRRRRRF